MKQILPRHVSSLFSLLFMLRKTKNQRTLFHYDLIRIPKLVETRVRKAPQPDPERVTIRATGEKGGSRPINATEQFSPLSSFFPPQLIEKSFNSTSTNCYLHPRNNGNFPYFTFLFSIHLYCLQTPQFPI